jgi:hypothetical protein
VRAPEPEERHFIFGSLALLSLIVFIVGFWSVLFASVARL